MTNKIKFFKEAIKNIKTSGTVMPSSKFLANRMLKNINFSEVEAIVELGPGNGAITQHILKRMPSNAVLVCFEINDNFYNQLIELNHKQLVVYKASAEEIEEKLEELGISKANHIISSLPLTIIPDKISKSILKKSFNVLQIGGTYIQYQYSLTYYRKLKTVFKDFISLDFEPLNFPPAFVYRCKKVD